MGLYATIDTSALEDYVYNAQDIWTQLAHGFIDAAYYESYDTSASVIIDDADMEADDPGPAGYDPALDDPLLESILNSSPVTEAQAAFFDTAYALCPVRTGYLLSTIGCADLDFWADADYAQYVEYGTRFMDAQPYFEPALEAAMQAYIQAAQNQHDDEAQRHTINTNNEISDAGNEGAYEAINNLYIADVFLALILMIIFALLKSLLRMITNMFNDAMRETSNVDIGQFVSIEIY